MSVSTEKLLCGVESRHIGAPISLGGVRAGSRRMGILISLSLTNCSWMTFHIWGPETHSVNTECFYYFLQVDFAQEESALEGTSKFWRQAKPAPGSLIVICMLSRCHDLLRIDIDIVCMLDITCIFYIFPFKSKCLNPANKPVA